MKVLVVTRQRARSFQTLFEGLGEQFPELVVHLLDKKQVHDIRPYLKATDFSAFDRVLFDVPLRRIGNASSLLRTIPGLVFYEEDACQEVVAESKFHRQFSEGFKALTNARVIVTSYYMRDYLIQQGVDAYCIPKAFDDAHLRALDLERDIPLGFIGRIKSQVYNQRRALLESMQHEFGLQMLRTETVDEYLHLLNRIEVFLSADIGFNEYMAKNFEAMACGCLLMAKRQPTEDSLLGFVDMVNVIHYDTLDEARAKLSSLRESPGQLLEIAEAGRSLVWRAHRLSQRVEDFEQILRLPARPCVPVARSLWQRLLDGLRNPRRQFDQA